MLNCFGIFFILSGHEHYSIDVFIAFYITSRLFLYYHTLANNQSLMQRDTGRTRIWFPLFSFFESDVDGIVPNEYESPIVAMKQLFRLAKYMYKKSILLFQSHFSNVMSENSINQRSGSIRKNKRKVHWPLYQRSVFCFRLYSKSTVERAFYILLLLCTWRLKCLLLNSLLRFCYFCKCMWKSCTRLNANSQI